MCKITTLIEVAKHFEPVQIMIVPAITVHNYARHELVHPLTNCKVTDHCFSFKTEVEHEEGKVVIIMDNGNVYGFKLNDVFILLDVWYTCNHITHDEHADLCSYFETWFNGEMPVSALDQITSVERRFTFNPINWLMHYIHRVDLRGLIPQSWFIAREQEQMEKFNREVRQNINPVFLPPSPINVNVDLQDVFDDITVSTTDFDVDGDELDVTFNGEVLTQTESHDN